MKNPSDIALRMEWYLLRESHYFTELKGKIERMGEIGLTRKEEEILKFISDGIFTNKNQIFEKIWKKKCVTKKTIDVHLFNLRKKLRKINRDVVSLENGELKIL